MMRFVKQVVPVLSLAVLGAAAVAEAGSATEFASCYKAADGSGYCYGTMQGFRNHANPNTYLSFVEDSYGRKSMSGSFPLSSPTGAASNFSCAPNAAVAAMWPRVMQHRGYIEVYWDVNGTCQAMWLMQGSHYTDF